MNRLDPKNSDILKRGTTIKTLIHELQSFENQDLEVRISFNCGDSSQSIGLVGKIDGSCVLINCE